MTEDEVVAMVGSERDDDDDEDDVVAVVGREQDIDED